MVTTQKETNSIYDCCRGTLNMALLALLALLAATVRLRRRFRVSLTARILQVAGRRPDAAAEVGGAVGARPVESITSPRPSWAVDEQSREFVAARSNDTRTAPDVPGAPGDNPGSAQTKTGCRFDICVFPWRATVAIADWPICSRS